MAAADLVRAVFAGVLAVWHDDPIVVYAVAFGLSAGAVFFNPAANSVLRSVVTDREVVAANSATWTAAVLSQIVLAPGGRRPGRPRRPGLGVRHQRRQLRRLGLVLRGLRPTEPPRAVGRRRLLAEAREGVALIGRDRLLRALAIGQLLAAVSAGDTSALLVVLAAEHLAAPADAYGLLVAAIGVGAALGPPCCRGLSPIRAVRCTSSAPTCCAGWSTWCSPRPAGR